MILCTWIRIALSYPYWNCWGRTYWSAGKVEHWLGWYEVSFKVIHVLVLSNHHQSMRTFDTLDDNIIIEVNNRMNGWPDRIEIEMIMEAIKIEKLKMIRLTGNGKLLYFVSIINCQVFALTDNSTHLTFFYIPYPLSLHVPIVVSVLFYFASIWMD